MSTPTARCTLRAARPKPVSQFIFVSTILVHGRSNDGRAPFSEGTGDAARLLRDVEGCRRSRLEDAGASRRDVVTVIRPPLIYGAGAKGNFALLASAVGLGMPLPFAGIDNHSEFLAVDNLSSFCPASAFRRGKN